MSVASRIGGAIASNLGISVSGGQLQFSDSQVLSAQAMVRKMLTTGGSGGKSLTSMKQNFQIFGIPILEVYGFRVGLAISTFAAIFLYLGWRLRSKNARTFRR